MNDYDQLFDQAAKDHGVDPNLLRAVAQTESSMNPNADSGKAKGLMQLTPETAKALGVSDPTDPKQAIPAAARLLRQNLDATGDDEKSALLMYHGGTDQSNWGPKTQAYPNQVYTNLAKIRQKSIASNDPVYQFLSGGKSTNSQPSSTPSSGDPVYDFLNNGGATSAPAKSAQPQQTPQIHPDPMNKDFQERLDKGGLPIGQFILNRLSGLGANIIGGYRGLATLASGGSAEEATKAIQDEVQKRTYQPDDNKLKNAIEVVDSEKNPMNWPGMLTSKAGNVAYDATGSPLIGAGTTAALNGGLMLAGMRGANNPIAIKNGANPSVVKALEPASDANPLTQAMAANTEAAPNKLILATGQKPRFRANPDGSFTPVQKMPVGAPVEAGVTPAENPTAASKIALPTIENAPPSIQDAVKKAGGNINQTAVQRHIESQSLPVPIELTEGQATGDLAKLSNEMNKRGQYPELANRFNEQNGKLIQNINAIRDSVAPDVADLDHVENGQSLINSYKAKDQALNADIQQKYKALEDANGGQFPLDGPSFVNSADAALAKKNRTSFVPPEVRKMMDGIKDGDQPMTYGGFEELRTILAAEARKAERAGDGNRAMAVSVIRNSLESLPMTDETAAIKPIADAARNAAKARFDLIDKDPAYKAAINDNIAPDDFINKFVVKGKVNDVKSMLNNLSSDPTAKQTIAAGAVNYLKKSSGILDDKGNFSQAGYNKTANFLDPKLVDLVGPDAAMKIKTLGNVARYTQEQPRGSFVNNSNTLVGAMANTAKDAAVGAANVGFGGIPVGTWTKNALQSAIEGRNIKKSLMPGAGIKKD